MATANDFDITAAAMKKLFEGKQFRPSVRATLIELSADEAGDPAVLITVLLDDATPDKDWVSSKLDPIAADVRAAVRAAGVDRWPYVRFARLSDAGGPDADKPQWKAAS